MITGEISTLISSKTSPTGSNKRERSCRRKGGLSHHFGDCQKEEFFVELRWGQITRVWRTGRMDDYDDEARVSRVNAPATLPSIATLLQRRTPSSTSYSVPAPALEFILRTRLRRQGWGPSSTLSPRDLIQAPSIMHRFLSELGFLQSSKRSMLCGSFMTWFPVF